MELHVDEEVRQKAGPFFPGWDFLKKRPLRCFINGPSPKDACLSDGRRTERAA